MGRNNELLLRIDSEHRNATARTRDVVEAGPFVLMLDPTIDLIFLNYAIPTEAGTPLDDDAVTKLTAVFRDRGLRPRLEFCAELWPDLQSLLLNNGFQTECVIPQMVCDANSFKPKFSPNVDAVVLDEQGDIASTLEVANAAFEMAMPISDERLEKSRKAIKNGWWIMGLAIVDGRPVGCATAVAHGGVCELCGVATVPACRRRGVASAVSSVVLTEHFVKGDLSWLGAGDDAARRVYERLGYERVGTQINMSLTSDA